MQGKGFLLQKGGPGDGSSYDSIADYEMTTSRSSGSGMGSLTRKLEALTFLPKPPRKEKAKNIKFNL